MGYRPLLVAKVTSPRITRIGLAQHSLGSFSTSVAHFNNEQLGKPTTNTSNTNVIDANTEAAPTTTDAKQPTSRIGKFIQQSKDLIKFYKDGLKQLWANNKEAKALQLKVANEGYELSRSEFQLIHQSKKDMVKLIPFGFVFMILPESVSNSVKPVLTLSNSKLRFLCLLCMFLEWSLELVSRTAKL